MCHNCHGAVNTQMSLKIMYFSLFVNILTESYNIGFRRLSLEQEIIEILKYLFSLEPGRGWYINVIDFNVYTCYLHLFMKNAEK